MRLPVLRCLPAMAAALLLCVLPSCASIQDPLMHATLCDMRERARPVIHRELRPVAEGIPAGISRGAGMEFDPPSIGGNSEGLWPLAVFYLFVYIGYGIGWCFYKIGELIWEACDSPEEQTPEQPAEGDSEPDPQGK